MKRIFLESTYIVVRASEAIVHRVHRRQISWIAPPPVPVAYQKKGMLTFEGDAAFLRNAVRTEDSVEQGKAGAVSNTGSGTIYFKGKLTMEENEAEVRVEPGGEQRRFGCTAVGVGSELLLI